MKYFKQFFLKRFGCLDFGSQSQTSQLIPQYNDLTRVVFVRAGGRIGIDFTVFDVKHDAVFFLTAGQFLQLDENSRGSMLLYNDEFYCIPLHDHEVASDELLISNVYNIAGVELDSNSSADIYSIFEEIKKEIIQDDIRLEEMVRVLLKQIIIKSTRFWKRQQDMHQVTIQHEAGFAKYFNRLVENNFLIHHDVASYASMLNITAKALNKRVSKHSRSTPNDIIKKRIILEAKRLLVHTTLTVKEIAYKLGYEDPSYFIRFFSKQVQLAPQSFRQNFMSSSAAVA
jgi:AraC-like DNA-binding protein